MKTKNISVWVACLLSMVACKQEAGYKITAKITGVEDGVTVILQNGREKIDSTMVKEGIFCFEGQTDEPFHADISIEKKRDSGVVNFLLCLSKIRISGSTAVGKICIGHKSQGHSPKLCIILSENK